MVSTRSKSRRLEVGLVEHVGRRPALLALCRHLEAQQWHAVAVAPLVGRGRLGESGQLVSETAGLEDPCRLVIEVHGARQRVGAGVAFDQEHAPPPRAEEQRERAADRPGADDDHVDPIGHRGAHRTAHAAWSWSRSGGTMNSSGRLGPHELATCSKSNGVRPRRSHASSSRIWSRSE